MSDTARTLRAGVDYSLWPQIKLFRARQLVSELGARIQLDSFGRSSHLVPKIADDQRSVTFYAASVDNAPVMEWSLLFADAVHNYRTALDALAWEMSHLDGRRPATEAMARRIYFPIFRSIERWNIAIENELASVPEDILLRMFAVQPFHREPVERGIAIVLDKLDIADKHRASLRLQLELREPDILQYRLLDHEGVPIAHDGVELRDLEADSALGVPVYRLRSNSSMIASAEAHGGTPVNLMIEVGTDSMSMFETLDLIDRQVAATFELLETGTLSDEFLDAEDAEP